MPTLTQIRGINGLAMQRAERSLTCGSNHGGDASPLCHGKSGHRRIAGQLMVGWRTPQTRRNHDGRNAPDWRPHCDHSQNRKGWKRQPLSLSSLGAAPPPTTPNTKSNMTASTFKCVLVCLFATPFIGCQVTSPTQPAQRAYIDVEFKKFVSGVFVDDLKDKFVRLQCRYISTIAGRVPGGYNPDNWMAFTAGSPPGGELVPARVTVVAPKQMADDVFALKHGD